MGLTSFKVTPTNTAEWDRFFRNVPVKPDPNSVGPQQLQDDAVATVNIQDGAVTTIKQADGSVTNVKLAPMPALSVKARALGTNGAPADLAAAVDGDFLVRRGTQLVFDPLRDTDIPATIARGADVVAAAAALTVAYTAADAVVSASISTIGDARYVPLSSVLNGSKTFDPPSIGSGAQGTTTVTVTGAVLGDYVLASFALDLQGITLHGYVSAADTVTVVFLNMTGGTLDLSSATLKARVWKQ